MPHSIQTDSGSSSHWLVRRPLLRNSAVATHALEAVRQGASLAPGLAFRARKHRSRIPVGTTAAAGPSRSCFQGRILERLHNRHRAVVHDLGTSRGRRETPGVFVAKASTRDGEELRFGMFDAKDSTCDGDSLRSTVAGGRLEGRRDALHGRRPEELGRRCGRTLGLGLHGARTRKRTALARTLLVRLLRPQVLRVRLHFIVVLHGHVQGGGSNGNVCPPRSSHAHVGDRPAAAARPFPSSSRHFVSKRLDLAGALMRLLSRAMRPRIMEFNAHRLHPQHRCTMRSTSRMILDSSSSTRFCSEPLEHRESRWRRACPSSSRPSLTA